MISHLIRKNKLGSSYFDKSISLNNNDKDIIYSKDSWELFNLKNIDRENIVKIFIPFFQIHLSYILIIYIYIYIYTRFNQDKISHREV